MPTGGSNITRWAWALIDLTVLVVAIYLTAWLRYDFSTDLTFASPVHRFVAIAAGIHFLAGIIVGPYAIGHHRGSYEEVADLTKTVATWAIPLQAASLMVPETWSLGPRSLPFTAAAVSLLGMFGARFVLRGILHRFDPAARSGTKVLVFGAGEGGRQLVRALVRDPGSELVPVGLLDDDKSKRRMRIDGVRVLGTSDDLSRVVEQTEATSLVIAVPSATTDLVKKMQHLAAANGLSTKILPPAHELLGGPRGADLRDLDLADFLGRRPIQLDATAITDTIAGRTVLVTGAGGSIGSELCRQISKFGPERLIMLDRDESALHSVQLSVSGHGLLDSDDVVLADIRDGDRMYEIFESNRPDVVFHAAALKHLPLLERYPREAWKTNVVGTLNVLRAARAAGVDTFVNVSTDKAANPSCVLGYSKRVTERLTADFAAKDVDDHTYVSVRFGNVLGSRGSVIAAFTAQIERGGPVTVTHPDVERYFMLIPEACQLVLQAAAIGHDGDVMVLDMGEPMKILDVANTLIDLTDRQDVEVVFTGLRPGEKMSEELFAPHEQRTATAHPLVNGVGVPRISEEEVARTRHPSAVEAIQWMQRVSVVQDDNEPSEAAVGGR